MRLPLSPIATVVILIVCNSNVFGAATNFNNQNRSANNSNFTNINFTNHSLLTQEPIFRRHLLNGTDTNSTHTNRNDACTSYNCIADKYYLNWVYGAVGAAALFFGARYMWEEYRNRRNTRLTNLEYDPPPPPMDYFPDGIFETENGPTTSLVIHNPPRNNMLLRNGELAPPLPALEDVRAVNLATHIHLSPQQNNLHNPVAHPALPDLEASQLSRSRSISIPTNTIHQGVPQYHRDMSSPPEASQYSTLERILPPKNGPAVDGDPVTPPRETRDRADAFLKGHGKMPPLW